MNVRAPIMSLLLLTCCAPSPSTARPASIERDGSGLWFMGSFSKDSARDLIAQMRPGDTLIVTSPGGEQEAALQVGRAIVERGVSVVVNARCYSACALYVYLPAKNRKINTGSYVWFHNTPNLWLQAMASRPDLFTADEKASLTRQYSETAALLKSTGVNPDIMNCIDAATEPKLSKISKSRMTPDSQLAGVPLPAVELSYNFVSLSPALLDGFGVKGAAEFEYGKDAPPNETLENVYGIKLKKVTTLGSCASTN